MVVKMKAEKETAVAVEPLPSKQQISIQTLLHYCIHLLTPLCAFSRSLLP
jgi:hypothetical protein